MDYLSLLYGVFFIGVGIHMSGKNEYWVGLLIKKKNTEFEKQNAIKNVKFARIGFIVGGIALIIQFLISFKTMG